MAELVRFNEQKLEIKKEEEHALRLSLMNKALECREAEDVLKNYSPASFVKGKNDDDADDFHVLSDHTNFINYKFKKQIVYNTLRWLNLIINLRFSKGYLYLRFLHERIKLQKKNFLLDLELGDETLIP